MSESLKHAQWAKSVERKHRQSKVKKTKKSPLPICAALACVLLSAGFYYASYEKPKEYPPLSAAAKQRISQFFAKQFLLGQWRLNKINYSSDAIQVYVQTPSKIALEGEALSQYLHYALCPVTSKRIWQDIKTRELSVYVFSHSIRKGDRTVCNLESDERQIN
jgi:hypothetical protein